MEEPTPKLNPTSDPIPPHSTSTTLSSSSLEPAQAFAITHLKTAADIQAHLPGLCSVPQACVHEGSSIGFLSPLSLSSAQEYFTSLLPAIDCGALHLFTLTSASASTSTNTRILGTVQLSVVQKQTHSHRAEVVKLLVHPLFRRRGIAKVLMQHVEEVAREMGKQVLVLDTAMRSSARDMYRALGWEEWGTCKDYASWPDGSRCDATFFRKEL